MDNTQNIGTHIKEKQTQIMVPKTWNQRIWRIKGKFDKAIGLFVSNAFFEKYRKIIRNEERVLIKYERMAGKYIEYYRIIQKDQTPKPVIFDNNPAYKSHWKTNTKRIETVAAIMSSLAGENSFSLIEVGAGELTTLVPLLKRLEGQVSASSALELAWSRLEVGKKFAKEENITIDQYIKASALKIPLPDNSIDIVFTSHCLEQIGKKSEQAISEMARIARKYIIMVEPGLEFVDKYQQKINREAGRVEEIDKQIKQQGLDLIRHELFPYCNNIFNRATLYVIEISSSQSNEPDLRCPCCEQELNYVEQGGYLHCDSCKSLYPQIKEIPCLREEDAILASAY